MPLEVVEAHSLGSGSVNEDRCGAEGSTAWIIDGATDVVQAPLAGAHSDAAWFAAELDHALRRRTGDGDLPLDALPGLLAEDMARAFRQPARREPKGRDEHPSAAGIIVRLTGHQLEYVSLGDCTLLVENSASPLRLGTDENDAGDRWVAEAIKAYQSAAACSTPTATREHLWPKLRAARATMNTEGGYGIFSITPPPRKFVHLGRVKLDSGATLLLATDGLMRLADVFRRYDSRVLFEAARERGIAALIGELRSIENADGDCTAFPRAKVSDDATGLLLRAVTVDA